MVSKMYHMYHIGIRIRTFVYNHYCVFPPPVIQAFHSLYSKSHTSNLLFQHWCYCISHIWIYINHRFFLPLKLYLSFFVDWLWSGTDCGWYQLALSFESRVLRFLIILDKSLMAIYNIPPDVIVISWGIQLKLFHYRCADEFYVPSLK